LEDPLAGWSGHGFYEVKERRPRGSANFQLGKLDNVSDKIHLPHPKQVNKF